MEITIQEEKEDKYYLKEILATAKVGEIEVTIYQSFPIGFPFVQLEEPNKPSKRYIIEQGYQEFLKDLVEQSLELYESEK